MDLRLRHPKDIALDNANDLISFLANALDSVVRADNLAFAQGAAEYAIREANRRRKLNEDGYLVVL